MTRKISTVDARRRIGRLLTRVSKERDEFIIERRGVPLAVLFPVERLEQIRAAARRGLLGALERQKGGGLTEEKAMDLAMEAKRWTRRARPKRRASR